MSERITPLREVSLFALALAPPVFLLGLVRRFGHLHPDEWHPVEEALHDRLRRFYVRHRERAAGGRFTGFDWEEARVAGFLQFPRFKFHRLVRERFLVAGRLDPAAEAVLQRGAVGAGAVEDPAEEVFQVGFCGDGDKFRALWGGTCGDGFFVADRGHARGGGVGVGEFGGFDEEGLGVAFFYFEVPVGFREATAGGRGAVRSADFARLIVGFVGGCGGKVFVRGGDGFEAAAVAGWDGHYFCF